MAVLGLIGAGFINRAIEGQNADRLADLQRQSLERSYDGELATYNLSLVTRETCLRAAEIRVDTRNDLRQALSGIVDLSDLFPDSESAKAYTVSRQALIDEKYPPLDVETIQAACPQEGVIPVDPSPVG